MYGYENNYSVNPYQQQQILQNRLNQIGQGYNGNYYQQSQIQQQQTQQMQIIKGRPVTSYDEAKASMIDLDGSIYVFTDVANKKIYTKQIMLDGTADLKTYVLEQPEKKIEVVEDVPKSTYVLREDFNKTIEGLKKQIDKLKGGVINVTTNDSSKVSE